MIRKKNVALNFGSSSGMPIDVFIRKTWGSYCSCFDTIKKRKTISNCPVCYNTNYLGGYFTPVSTKCFWGISVKQIQDAGFEIHPDNQYVETANYPLLSPGDIIKQLDTKKIFRVNNVRATRRRTYIVSQFAQLREVNFNEIEATL